MLADCPPLQHKELLRCLNAKDPRNYRNDKGRNVLMEYLVHARPINSDIVKFLLDEVKVNVAQVCNDDWNCLLWACKNPTITYEVV